MITLSDSGCLADPCGCTLDSGCSCDRHRWRPFVCLAAWIMLCCRHGIFYSINVTGWASQSSSGWSWVQL